MTNYSFQFAKYKKCHTTRIRKSLFAKLCFTRQDKHANNNKNFMRQDKKKKVLQRKDTKVDIKNIQ